MTDRDSTDLPEEPTPAWLRTALDAPAPVDEGTRERHLRTALAAFDDDRDQTNRLAPRPAIDIGARRRAGPRRWLAAAAAVILTVGVGGLIATNTETGTQSSSDQLASDEGSDSSTNDRDTTASAEAESPTDVGAGNMQIPAADGSTTEGAAAAGSRDLGAFDTDADLRSAVATMLTDSASKAPLPPTGGSLDRQPEADARSAASCPAPPLPPGSTVDSLSSFTATVDGLPVQVWVIAGGEGATVSVVDAATCTVRPA